MHGGCNFGSVYPHCSSRWYAETCRLSALLHRRWYLPIFDAMKRMLFHLLFWLAYYCLTVYFEWQWLDAFGCNWPAGVKLLRASITGALYTLPYMALAYYLLHVGVVNIIQRSRHRWQGIAMVLASYFAAIFTVIVFARLVALPYVYDNLVVPQGHFIQPAKFFTLMLEAAFPAGVLLSIQFVEMQMKAKEREQTIIKEKLNTELQLLKSQLNPHFLFNTLNNIYGLTRKKSDMAPEAVLKLSEMLSFMLYEANSGTISIKKEMQFLDDYISLQRLRYPDSFRIVFNKMVDDEERQIAPLLLLPLLENAFKHGAGDSHADSYIHIDLKLQQAQLMFTITNSYERNGQDMRSDTIGLHNIKRQLQLLYRTQQLVLMDNENVFTAQLNINLDSYEKI